MAKRKTTKKTLSPSKSYQTFETVAKRSLDLITMQAAVEKIMALDKKATPLDLSDLTRASVVLAVAAMDAYFTDIFAERFVPYLKKKGPTKAMVQLLTDAGLDTKCALELLAMQRPFRRIRKLIEDYHEHTTTQRCGVIDKLFLAYGMRDFSANVEKLKRRKTLLKSVENLVKRRHSIAHEGDLNAHGKLKTIAPHQTRKRIEDLVAFVAGADELLQNQLTL